MGAWLSRLTAPSRDGAGLTAQQFALINCGAWIALQAVQFGLPLDFRSETTRRFDTPITPAGYCFGVIWSTIFLLQGIGSVVPLLPGTQWAAPYVRSIGWLWSGTWLIENTWTVIQAIQQRAFAGRESTAGFALAFAMLLGGHITMSLALRKALGPFQDALFSAKAPAPPPSSSDAPATPTKQPQGDAAAGDAAPPAPAASTLLQRVGGAALYVVPSALNAGWLGLATGIGALDVAVAARDLKFQDLVKPGQALLPLAAATAALQPWWNPDPPAGRCPVGGGAVLPLVVGGGAYTAAVAWGLSGMLARDDVPGEIKVEAKVLLGVLPVLAVGGWLCRLMVGVKRAKAKKAQAEAAGEGAAAPQGAPGGGTERQPLLT